MSSLHEERSFSHGNDLQSSTKPDRGDNAAKPLFESPKLTFVAPKLVKHGDVSELTGFFGAFSP